MCCGEGEVEYVDVSAIRDSITDFVMTWRPCWMCQRSITCAGALCAAAISPMTGFSSVDACGPSR
ncbi:hypothetical protein AB431_12380 [Mycobacterium sp. EPa45]|nr:hypothetical protein AB431_12380 [Mycobacterium sp. EPa45]